jgi:hypothetical protein
LLVICPASLREQWAQELLDKFAVPTTVDKTRPPPACIARISGRRVVPRRLSPERLRVSLNLSTNWPCAGISTLQLAADFVPTLAWFTHSCLPSITYRWNASLTYELAFGRPKILCVLVSLSVNNNSCSVSKCRYTVPNFEPQVHS